MTILRDLIIFSVPVWASIEIVALYLRWRDHRNEARASRIRRVCGVV